MSIRRKFTFVFILSALATACALFAGNVLLSKRNDFMLTVCVKDGFSGMPVMGASVVIPEVEKRLVTDSEGFTAETRLPFVKDIHYSRLQKQDFGIATVLVYRDGYTPYALFYLRTRAGQRRTITIYIFPNDGTMSEPFSVIESPDDGWIAGFVERFCPES